VCQLRTGTGRGVAPVLCSYVIIAIFRGESGESELVIDRRIRVTQDPSKDQVVGIISHVNTGTGTATRVIPLRCDRYRLKQRRENDENHENMYHRAGHLNAVD
jgi:hypothetical protein